MWGQLAAARVIICLPKLPDLRLTTLQQLTLMQHARQLVVGSGQYVLGLQITVQHFVGEVQATQQLVQEHTALCQVVAGTGCGV